MSSFRELPRELRNILLALLDPNKNERRPLHELMEKYEVKMDLNTIPKSITDIFNKIINLISDKNEKKPVLTDVDDDDALDSDYAQDDDNELTNCSMRMSR